MLGKLYSTDILTLSSTLSNTALDAPDGTARKVSKLCGSWVEIDVAMSGDRVADAALRVQACALGQASAAILQERINGATLGELTAARDALRFMLKEGGDPPKGRFEKLALLSGVREYPARHQSTLLAFDAAVEAVDRALQRECNGS
ncbi:iron-sulfur cluster assembly scaffold protein [Algimonas porphyrae]|uniref:Iron-sulfur cluster assembly scaffold protein n=1 Tax=Algimonas porphyrae TaxID=1128113 RepID=A0ABQ5UY49_9PROT|nr:iron-sulfur cluster assembly scaffold protein [Algimonas porphyrae]GLQ19349.1 iron-sulfur cluster assembly scaffold protein [Algimonas porphyrae]